MELDVARRLQMMVLPSTAELEHLRGNADRTTVWWWSFPNGWAEATVELAPGDGIVLYILQNGFL